jgi:anti-sigma regulatory factor (Ser/Thr protein kinase)
MMTRRARAEWAFSATSADKALAARTAFVDHLRESADPSSDLDAAQLIYSELVGNVVRHAPGPISIDVDWTRERHARLCVRDSGDGFRADYRLPADRLSEGGRGLFIVAQLSDTVTVSRDEAGTCVCAILPVQLAA